MYQRIKEKSSIKRDRTVIISLIVVAVILISVLIPIIIGSVNSYRYHCFVRDFSQTLVYSRHAGEVTMISDGKKEIPVDYVSNLLVHLTEYSVGQPVKEIPDAENVLLKFPDGATLTIYSTPGDNGLDYPTGVTVRYEDKDGKVFMYLQRYAEYSLLYSILDR